MKKQLINITMTCLIALSAGIRSSEISPKNKVSNAEVVAASVNVAEITPVTVTPVDTNKKTPLLVPFDQGLYKVFCIGRQSTYKSSVMYKLATFAFGAFVIGSQLSSAVTNRQNFFNLDPFKKSLNDYLALTWGWKVAAIFYKVIPAGFLGAFQVASCAMLVSSTLNAMKTTHSDFNNLILWEDREKLRVLEQQILWHQEVFAQFGKPEVIGTIPLSGKYILKGTKKYGAGQVIFDPFNSEQVKILLDAHGSITEDLRCSKIEIIAVEEVKTEK